jgi:putative secretion ATPase (PEP-CTERM system associated)
MYEDYYGLNARPFQLTPDPDYYFDSRTHRKALSYLGYGLAQGEGFIVITGEIGSGKSTLVAHLMRTIDTTRLNVAQIVSSQLGASDLLQMIAIQFGLSPAGMDKATLLTALESHFHDQARHGRRSLLIVDEAQMLDRNALEELRMLSNLQLGNQALLQIFLLGQPEFRDMLHGDDALEQLRQRVIATHHLEGMSEDEVQPYIEHRLRKAGWDGTPGFSNGAIAEIYQYSQGIPRLLNAFMSRVLLMGAMEEADAISGLLVRAVHADIVSDVPMPKVQTAVMNQADDDQSDEDIDQGLVQEDDINDQAPEPVMDEPSSAMQFVDSAQHEAFQAELEEREAARAEAMALVLERIAGLEQKLEAKQVNMQDLMATADRVGALEARMAEQERAMRRIVTKLIGWVEAEDVRVRRAA